MDNIGSDCCFCFNKGEVDLLEHKVIIENYDTEIVDDDECIEISAIDLFKIYYNMDILSSSIQLKLICQLCLKEQILCYKFYRKIMRAVKRKQSFYEAAEKFPTEQLDDLIIEVFEKEEDAKSSDNHSRIEENGQEELGTTQTEFSYIEIDSLTPDESLAKTPAINQTESPAELAQTNCFGSVESIEQDHIIPKEDFICISENESNNSADCDTISFDENTFAQLDQELENEKEEIKLPEPKRPRLKILKEKLGSTGQPPHEDASLVVTQFLPVKTQMKLETHLVDNESNNYESSLSESQDLSTVDYTVVEIKSSNFQQTENGELEFNADDLCSDESKEQIFVCKYCPQAFAAATYLIAHVKKSHVCKYCTKAFVKSLDLYVHIRQAHYQHKCAICQKEFSSQSNLRMHIKRVHGIRLPAQVALLDYKLPNATETGD